MTGLPGAMMGGGDKEKGVGVGFNRVSRCDIVKRFGDREAEPMSSSGKNLNIK